MELNDLSDYQRCFACGQRNPYGLHMLFRQEQERVFADIQPQKEHQSFPGIIHGGIVAAILDEALSRTSLLSTIPAWTMTGRLEVRYRRQVPYGPLLRVQATLENQRGRMFQAFGILTLAEDEGNILAEAKGTFMALGQDTLDSMVAEYPETRALLDI